MANREKGEALIEIDGASYTLALNTNTLCTIETLFSIGAKDVAFQDVLNRAAQGSIVAARGVFWAMLQEHHPQISIKEAGRLLDTLGASEVGKQLAGLMPHATPDPQDVEALTGPKGRRPQKARVNGRAAGGTGSTSKGTRSGSA